MFSKPRFWPALLAAAMTLLTKWWLNSSDGQDSLPTPLLLCHYKHQQRHPDHHSGSSHSNRNTQERRSYHPITEQNRENQDVVDWDRELWCRDLRAIVIKIFKSIDKTTNKSGCGGLWRQKIVILWFLDNYDRKKCFQSSRYAIFRVAVDQWKNNIYLMYMNQKRDDQLNQKPKSTWISLLNLFNANIKIFLVNIKYFVSSV